MRLKENKTCIIIAGPTAVGKTHVAVSLAKLLQTEIISADSRQCYRELNIGVAKPSAKELKEIPHYFIDSLSIQEIFSAADYEKFALEKTNEIFKRKDVVIVVGGTGLYIKAFCEGMDEIPEIDIKIREEIRQGTAQNGLEWSQNKLLYLDSQFCKTPNFTNPQRCMRALEVIMSTGKPIAHFQQKNIASRPFSIKKILLQLPTNILYERINNRVDEMVSEGLFHEAMKLLPFKELNALNTVGYKEIFNFLEGKSTREEAIELIKRNTRRYAKRQNTWFRNSAGYISCRADINEVQNVLQREGLFKT